MAADAEGATLRFGGMISDSALAALLPGGETLAALIERAGRPGFRAVPLGVRLDAAFRTCPRTVMTHNVIGVVPGRDSALAGEHVVPSAHWDGYGIGPAVNGDSIYNGALDDGSGMTALLALVQVFAAHPQRRSITFLFTTAEEWIQRPASEPGRIQPRTGVHGTAIKPHIGPLPEAGRWLRERAERAGQDEVADWIRYLFGTTVCPSCGRGFDVHDAITKG